MFCDMLFKSIQRLDKVSFTSDTTVCSFIYYIGYLVHVVGAATLISQNKYFFTNPKAEG